MSSIACKSAALVALLAGAAAAASACGGSAKGADEPGGAAAPSQAAGTAEPADQDKDKEKEGLEVSGTRGVLQNAQIQAGIAPRAAALEACYKTELKQKKFLSGKVVLQIDVGKTGEVSGAGITESDLGDWAVERCLVGEARAMRFAKPTGGDGQAEFQLPLDFTSDQPALDRWSDAEVSAVTSARAGELGACGAAPAVTVTAYVGNRGAVQSVGFSAAPPVADAWGECAARAVAGWTFADPHGKTVKAQFQVQGRSSAGTP